MKKKSFVAVLCSVALLFQTAPAVFADGIAADGMTDSVVTTEETITTDTGEFGNATWILKGDTLTLIGDGDLPDSVDKYFFNHMFDDTDIENYVYYPWMKYRNVVKHLVIKGTITDIPVAAFAFFYQLETVEFPSSPITIRSYSFYATEFDIVQDRVTNTTFDIPDNVKLDGKWIFYSDDSKDYKEYHQRITIRANRYSPAYYYCLEHPCYIFKETGIAPEAITSGTCGKNATWNFDFDTKTLFIEGTGATSSINDETTLNGLEWIRQSIQKVVYGEGITEIAPFTAKKVNNHFSYNEPLENATELVLPSTLKTIDDYAFDFYSSLSDVQIPYGVTTIGNNALSDCYQIKNVVLPGSVKKIGDYAFSTCDSLESITIPASVTDIGQRIASASYDSDFTIYGYTGSTAESYAKENNYPFKPLSDATAIGDINQDSMVDLMDAILLNKYLAGVVTLTDLQLRFANCNNADGTDNITEEDLSSLMQFIIGVASNLPVSE